MKTIAAILILLSILTSAHAIDCTRAPDRTPGPFWRYRVIDNQQCWYRSETVLPKSELQWATAVVETSERVEPAKVEKTQDRLPLKPVPVQTIAYRVEAPPRQDYDKRWLIALGIISSGFGVAMAGMLWPLRARKGAA